MNEAVVLNEIALIPREEGGFWLYIGHPSRLQHVIQENEAARVFPASLVHALEGAHRRYGAWDREMETVFDIGWREALEPPQRILFTANGRVEQIEEVAGVTWAALRDALRVRSSDGRVDRSFRAIEGAASSGDSSHDRRSKDQRGQPYEALTNFVRAFQNAESWVRLAPDLARSMATIERTAHTQ